MTIVKQISGSMVSIPGNDIDTDRIIPARYLKEITFERMGDYLFADARYNPDGTLTDHPLNDPRYVSASIMVVGRNFGCGSSREHAPQSIKRYGIRALIGESFAEIFAGNCMSLGMPAVSVTPDVRQELEGLLSDHPTIEAMIDLDDMVVRVGTRDYPITLPAARRHAFLNGTWNFSALLSANSDLVKATAARLPYMNAFRGPNA
ncbi:3-isopropylmalate dehydratase small subunit [bacterium]|nr:3-isopropylmalate dehydratase small subunit [bacterium]